MIVRTAFFKLVTTGILICGIIIFLLNFVSFQHNGNDFGLIDNSNAYVMSNRDGDSLILIKADVKSNSKPAILYANDGKIDIPEVRIRSYMVSTSHDQVRMMNFTNLFSFCLYYYLMNLLIFIIPLISFCYVAV